jgi:hypothetical protein
VLSDDVYQSLSEAGAKMTNAGAARYALDQIDQAPSRTERRLK